jgi:hypothetical protein
MARDTHAEDDEMVILMEEALVRLRAQDKKVYTERPSTDPASTGGAHEAESPELLTRRPGYD